MKRSKQGVSLIVLVITIIVMIILAGSVILSLSNTNIFTRAEEAVDATNLKQVQSIAAIAWAEAYLDKIDDPTVNLTDRVMKALEDNKVNINKYDIEVTDTGVTVALKGSVPADWKASVREVTEDGVPIPIGFVASPYGASENYPAENTKAGGLVIYALTEDEIKDGVTDIVAIDGKGGTLTEEQAHYESLIKRNQFVWVPVDSDKFETLFKRTAFYGETISPTLGVGEDDYWELVLDATNMPSATQDTDYVSPATLQEATAMYASVKKYGGFYIARYEAGKDDAGAISITMGKYPYNYVAWGTSMSNEVKTNGAVTLSRSFYPSTDTTYGVVSTLTYGVQWDRTLNWWKELSPSFNLNNSTDYGVYLNTEIALTEYNSGAKYSADYGKSYQAAIAKNEEDEYLMTTGAYKKANVYNIYDMAGSLEEWTMEGEGPRRRVYRGGYYLINGDDPVVCRFGNTPYYDDICEGFRPSLYIK